MQVKSPYVFERYTCMGVVIGGGVMRFISGRHCLLCLALPIFFLQKKLRFYQSPRKRPLAMLWYSDVILFSSVKVCGEEVP